MQFSTMENNLELVAIEKKIHNDIRFYIKIKLIIIKIM